MKIMNILEGRWSQFKQELLPLLYLSFVQTWWNFNFPPFIRLGTPLSTIVGISMSIASVLIYISIFVFPEKYAPIFNLEYLDDAPNATTLKEMYSICFITIAHVTMLFAWYKDFYGMSNIYYALCYAHCVIAFMLIVHVIDRYNNKIK